MKKVEKYFAGTMMEARRMLEPDADVEEEGDGEGESDSEGGDSEDEP